MGATAQKNDKNQAAEIPVGEILRRTRIHYKQSIQDIERALRIRADQIEAIENGSVEKLPGRVYAVGFIRTYSEYLGSTATRWSPFSRPRASAGPNRRRP